MAQTYTLSGSAFSSAFSLLAFGNGSGGSGGSMTVHLAKQQLVQVDNVSGNVIQKSTASINQVLNASNDHRIVNDPDNANTANWPTLAQYLALEAAAGYILTWLDQYNVVTYKA